MEFSLEKVMKAQFVISPTSPEVSRLPRTVRVFIRKNFFHPAKPQALPESRRDFDVDFVVRDALSYSDPMGETHAYNCNTVDPDFDLDGSIEFGDSTEDDNLHGLTIVEPGHGNIRRWLRGDDIL